MSGSQHLINLIYKTNSNRFKLCIDEDFYLLQHEVKISLFINGKWQ